MAQARRNPDRLDFKNSEDSRSLRVVREVIDGLYRAEAKAGDEGLRREQLRAREVADRAGLERRRRLRELGVVLERRPDRLSGLPRDSNLVKQLAEDVPTAAAFCPASRGSAGGGLRKSLRRGASSASMFERRWGERTEVAEDRVESLPCECLGEEGRGGTVPRHSYCPAD